jgi:hypothetical protein
MALSQTAAYSPPSNEFEYTYERSYSHGLEKIYALENVDVRSIRKIAPRASFAKSGRSKKISKSQLVKHSDELEFNFEPPFQKALPSFVYKEPIQVLGLSKRIEQLLLSQEKFLLSDLLDDHQALLAIKGLGQGHCDEISDKLQNYLDEHLNDENPQKIDYASWMKTLVGDLSPKKCAVLLEAYNLPPLLTLSPADNAELRKLTSETRLKYTDEVLLEIRTPKKTQQVTTDFQMIVDIYIKPWMCRRAGLASLDELQEYLIKLGNSYPHTLDALYFLSTAYFKGHSPLSTFLFLKYSLF